MSPHNLSFEVCYKLDISIVDDKYPRKLPKREPIGDTALIKGDRQTVREVLSAKIESIMDELIDLYYGEENNV